jgi:hypothetical protein
MNREFVEKWISALRSGEYKQCRTGGYSDPFIDKLTPSGVDENTSLCCLGLGAHLLGALPSELHVLLKEVPEIRTLKLPTQARVAQSNDQYEYGPDEQRSLECHLTAMNDGNEKPYSESRYKPHSFSQIADFLEEVLLNASSNFSKGPTA